MASPEKDEIKNFAISILIALTPVVIAGALFWHSSKKPEPPVTAVARPEHTSPAAQPAVQATAAPDKAKNENIPIAQKNTARPAETPVDNVAKAKNIEREKSVPERRRHVSVLPDPQPKEAEVASTASQVAEPAKATQNDASSQTKPVSCEFRKFASGVVERRTYPSAEMCDQAQKMWRDGFRLLEPDGSINEKYVIRKEPARIPGFPN